MKHIVFSLLSLCWLLCLTPPQPAWAQAVLENPQPASVQSGIGVISGWACDAQRIDIVIDDGPPLRAGYGTSRADTELVCGDVENGFGVSFNWNLLNDGPHTLRVFVDDMEFGVVAFRVATFGVEFLQDVSDRFQVSGFPEADSTLELVWQQSLQSFVIAQGSAASGGNTGPPNRVLENPQPGSFQSGVGVVSGFVCDADRIDIEINGSLLLRAGYGTSRADTELVCGDTENGFGLLFNWNLLGAGTHTVRALADGVAFATSTFRVATFGTEFLQGEEATFLLPGFPEAGTNARVRWQQSLQNFTLEGMLQEGITQSECGTMDGMLADTEGLTADAQVTNPCSRTGDSAEMLLFPFFSGSLGETNVIVQSQETEFFACFTLLSIEQAGVVYNGGIDFLWLDGSGQPVCQPLRASLATILAVNAGVSLNFNLPFRIIYNSLDVVAFEQAPPVQLPILSVAPASLNFGTILPGNSAVQNYEICNEGEVSLSGTSRLTLTPEVSDSFTLAPNECTDIPVTITAEPQAGSFSGQIEIISNAGSATIPITFSVVISAPPQLSVSPSSLNFGTIPFNGTAVQNFTITNVGGGTLSGSWIATTVGVGSSNPVPFSLGPGQNTTEALSVTAGTVAGDLSGGISISSNGGSATIPYAYTVIDPTPLVFPFLSVSPTNINLGTIPIGGSASGRHTITNAGGGTLTGTSAFEDGSPLSSFSLAAGESLTETVTIAAGSQPGTFSRQVIITSNGGSATVTYTYTVIDPTPPQLSVSPTSINLGTIPPGGSASGRHTITNVGGGTLTGTSDFDDGSLPFSLAARESLTETVTITAGSQPGTFSKSVIITSNGGNATVTYTYTVESVIL